MQLNKKYQRSVMALSPYISIQEERELNSLWALMRNREDLEQIQQRLKSLAEKHGLADK
jgi:hypothetical protein